MAPFLYLLTLLNINQFSEFVIFKISEKIVIALSLRSQHTSGVPLHYLVSFKSTTRRHFCWSRHSSGWVRRVECDV